MTIELEVLLHGAPVGSLTEDEHGQRVLRFSDAYRNAPNRPVLGQKFEDDLTRAYRGRRGSLPPFFANLIPERNGELRPILEAQLGVAPDDDLALLEVLGRDLPGAVEVRRLAATTRMQPGDPEIIEPTVPRDRDDESMRFSLAGVQLKFSVILADDKLTLPAHGSLGDWLVKLDSKRFPNLCENEYAVMRWAKLAGFDVPECRLLPAEALLGKLGDHAEPDTHVLAIRRFDRNGARIHQEDFAQIANLLPEHKYDHVSYEQLAKLVGALVDEGAQDELLRRFALMLASGNSDAHLKNWSLVYPDKVHPQLAPLYDQVATVAWPEVEQKVALNFAKTKTLAEIDHAVLARFADRCGLEQERVRRIVDGTVEGLADAWRDASRLPGWSLPRSHEAALRDHWRRMPLLRDGPLARL